jgi:hypothetical protein
MLHDHGHDYCNNDNNKPFVLVLLDQAGKGTLKRYHTKNWGRKKTGCQISPATLLYLVQILFVHGERLIQGTGAHFLIDKFACPALFFFFLFGRELSGIVMVWRREGTQKVRLGDFVRLHFCDAEG